LVTWKGLAGYQQLRSYVVTPTCVRVDDHIPPLPDKHPILISIWQVPRSGNCFATFVTSPVPQADMGGCGAETVATLSLPRAS
jgi:hypothetical protein